MFIMVRAYAHFAFRMLVIRNGSLANIAIAVVMIAAAAAATTTTTVMADYNYRFAAQNEFCPMQHMR